MIENGTWKVDLAQSIATHTNGTVVIIENGQAADITRLPSSIDLRKLSIFIKSAELAYAAAHKSKKRPQRPVLSLKK